MIILFTTKKLEKECNDERLLKRRYGILSKTIRRRLDDLDAASTMGTLKKLPQYQPKKACHELTADYKGCIALELSALCRLIIQPANNPVPRKDDGGLDWDKITSIRIIEVTNYHKGY